MKSYNDALTASWVNDLSPITCAEAAQLFGMIDPISIYDLIGKLETIETVDLSAIVVTPEGFPLGGRVELIARSDGSYTFKGEMRATGGTSYYYSLQAFITAADNVKLAAMHTGRVFGSDTPGPRDRTWEESQFSKTITQKWKSIRNQAGFEYRLDANIAGVTGTLYDILRVAIDAIVANCVLGLGGMLIVLGEELGAAAGVNVGTPGVLAGVMTSGGVVLIFGVGFVFPALVAGIVVGSAVDSDIKHRALHVDEKEFARKVLGDKIPYDDIICTNLSHDNGRCFTIPTAGSTLLCMDHGLDQPDGQLDKPTLMHYVPPSGYTTPGQLFIHELIHAWQIKNATFLPGLVCDAAAHADQYDYKSDASWTQKPWGDWHPEQQAHIVDDWFGVNAKDWSELSDLESKLAIAGSSDPAFHYISNNIIPGVPG